jgi:hypothetical protein
VMDQIVKALGVINSFRVEGLEGAANPTQGARLNLEMSLQALRLTAADGSDPGVTISLEGFGAHNLSLPTPQDPAIAVDPYARALRVDLDDRFFARAAIFAKEPVVAEMYQAINRVQMTEVQAKVRVTSAKVAHIDLEMDKLSLQHDDEELIRVTGLSLSVLDIDTRRPPPVALKEAVVVLRKLRVEIGQRFFELILKAARKKIPPMVNHLAIELPGPVMVVDAKVKGISFRVDLKFETENDMFGIYFDRFYVPGTNVRLPGISRNIVLGLIRSVLEGKLKGLVEISNESMRINPWGKIPLSLLKRVKDFKVEDKRIVVEFDEPTGNVPLGADDHARGFERSLAGATATVLAPGPAL